MGSQFWKKVEINLGLIESYNNIQLNGRIKWKTV